MALTAQVQNGLTLVEMEGPRLDAACADQFKEDLKKIIDGGTRRIVLDFDRVEFMDSSGLGSVVGCLKYMGAAGTVEIARPTPTIMKILKLTRMNKVFTIHDDLPDF